MGCHRPGTSAPQVAPGVHRLRQIRVVRPSEPGHKNGSSTPYAVVAQELGVSVGAVKSAVSRLRQRYGELVREEVAHTVSTPGEIEAEIRHLRAVIGG